MKNGKLTFVLLSVWVMAFADQTRPTGYFHNDGVKVNKEGKSKNGADPAPRGEVKADDKSPDDYVTHDRMDGNTGLPNAKLILLCEGKKNDELLKVYKKPEDVVERDLLQAGAPQQPQAAQGAAAVQGNGDAFDQLIEQKRREWKGRLGNESNEFFERIEAQMRSLREQARVNRAPAVLPASTCSAEEKDSARVLKALARAKSGRVFAEVNCNELSRSSLFKQLVSPYRHIILQDKDAKSPFHWRTDVADTQAAPPLMPQPGVVDPNTALDQKKLLDGLAP